MTWTTEGTRGPDDRGEAAGAARSGAMTGGQSAAP
eukprot:CAMPEP_0204438584 /NCGR_PEP_ID=MMETSP0470-20130426/79702_1 /ASSEMBLY_ACC=CAM_ASM_000385 /TAXON_ID=2969 /ORGANISM="Oxyrrhis marina" /LENGTH=34 /DNA_ID= /DNA_START= /DNA_END= /DNA_ORIENTATION=